MACVKIYVRIYGHLPPWQFRKFREDTGKRCWKTQGYQSRLSEAAMEVVTREPKPSTQEIKELVSDTATKTVAALTCQPCITQTETK